MNLMIIVQIYIFGAKLCDHKHLDDGDVMVIGDVMLITVMLATVMVMTLHCFYAGWPKDCNYLLLDPCK